MWGQSEVLDFHMGAHLNDQVLSDESYNNGAGYAAVNSGAATGRASLTMLSVAIIGVMFFYVATRGRQY